jgi:cysteine desulfurase / selenocysteine lyase
MNTSDRPPATPDAIPPGAEPGDASASGLTEQIARLANQMFAALPGAGLPVPPTPGIGLQPPPAPGFVQQPPVTSAPLPHENDLRTLPVTLSGGFLPVLSLQLVDDRPEPSNAAPYFLGLAGPPPAATPAAPNPGVPTSAVPFGVAQPPTPGVAQPPTPGVAQPPTPGVVPSSTPGVELQFDAAPTFSRPFETRLFDPYSLKRDFPILQERVNGRPLVWLDNAATTQKPQAVIDRISYYYTHENSNVHRAAHTLAARSTDAYEAARDKVRRFLNAPSAKDIVFTRGATEAINLVAKSWGRRNIAAGDEIVISWLEHHANIVPWQQVASETGARLRVAPVDDRGQVVLEEYEKLLGPRTRLVSMSHVSNALGTIVPVREVIEMAHRHGAKILIDGAQAVSHLAVDVQALDCDFYCFSGHKVFAPTGIGALYGKGDLLAGMPPWQGGGNMIADVTFEKTVYQPPPGRFEAGTGSIADAVGLGAALDYVGAIGLPNIARYEHELLEYATDCLATVPGLRMIGTAPEKAGVLSFVLDGVKTEEVGGLLDQEGIAVRSGHHCAQPILRRFGLESTVRASLAPYNTRDDIDALTAALRRLQASRPIQSARPS